MDEEILELVSEADSLYEVDESEDEDQLAASFEIDKRPSTGTEDDQETAEDMKVKNSDMSRKIICILSFGGYIDFFLKLTP